MPKPADPIPTGFHTITPHLNVEGAAKYLDFLKAAFGAVELGRAPGPGGKLMHALVRIGDSMLMLADNFPEFGSPAYGPSPWPVTMNLYVTDADETFDQAVSAGCQVVMPLADQFWGDRYGFVRDPFGFNWAIATRKEELTREEIEERQKKFCGGGAAA